MVQKKILRYERTPYAKQIRKDYERGIVKCILPRPAATEALSQRPPGPDSAAT